MLLNDIDTASIIGSVTVTLHIAILPLLVAAVIVAVPTPTAVITPSETVTTLVLLVVHITLLSVASFGVIEYVNTELSPFSILIKDLFNIIDEGSTIGALTVTLHVTETDPS